MRIWTSLFLLVAIGSGGCATVEDVLILDDRIASLEAQRIESEKKLKQLDVLLDEIGKQRDAVDQDVKGRYAGMRAQLNNLETDLQGVRGQLEEVSYHLNQYKEIDAKLEEKLARLDLAITKNTDRLMRLEQYLGLAAAGAGAAAAGETAAAGQKMSEEELYRLAKQAFDAGKYDAARAGFQRLLAEYPQSPNADNAQFWVGETYYREKWYEKAILEYHEVIKNHPKGNKIPAAMLKQGLAFQAIGDKKNAGLILKELVSKHPKSNEAAIARKKLDEF